MSDRQVIDIFMGDEGSDKFIEVACERFQKPVTPSFLHCWELKEEVTRQARRQFHSQNLQIVIAIKN